MSASTDIAETDAAVEPAVHTLIEGAGDVCALAGETDEDAASNSDTDRAASPISSTTSDDKPSIDLSLPSALSALTHHLTAPLAPHYSHTTILALRSTLTSNLTALFQPTWREHDPAYGSGTRSLICLRSRGLPRPLKHAAAKNGVAEKVWRAALHKKGKDGQGSAEDVDRARKARMDEWEAWCDPGQVSWRYGMWEWFDSEFDPIKTYTEPIITIWRATTPTSSGDTADILSSIITPARPSAAIRIRAPDGQAVTITPTPSRTNSGSVLITRSNPLQAPVAPLALSPSAHIRAVTSGVSLRSPVMLDETPSRGNNRAAYPSRQAPTAPQGRQGHRACSESTSSVSSESSLAESTATSATSQTTQLLTPASRPGSADPFSSAPRTGLTVGIGEDGEKRKIVPLTLLRKDQNKENEVGDKAKGKISSASTPVARGRDPSPNTITASASTASSATAGKTTPTNHANANTNTTDKAKHDTAASASGPTTTVHFPVPTVTPYDGGNVTVLGGGVKLGGAGAGSGTASRTGSVMSQHRIPYDRARSPSISLASRALNTALSPNEGGPQMGGGGGGGRKPRTRRRIMPTYLGYVGQPGVGGPVPHAFQNMGMMGPPQPSQLGQQVLSASSGTVNTPVTTSSVNNNVQAQTQVSPVIQQVPNKQGPWTGNIGVGIGMPPVRQPLQRLA